MTRIKLPRGEWNVNLDAQIGPRGGFGTVFEGTHKDYPILAIKRLNITAEESANRELRIADELINKNHAHIIPIYDAGQDAQTDFYYVVMARAERSLNDEIDNQRIIQDREAAEILLQIVLGVAEANNIVHRDLKPGNILLHNGVWKIGDFGIAKFVEESTSLQTLKDCLSPQYAAPEQWRFETATRMTDLYAVGCIGYRLISGRLPFSGKDLAEYQHQHLFSEVPPLETKNPLMRTLISMLLRKNPEARPTLDRVRVMLEKIIQEPERELQSFGLNALASAGALEAEILSAAEAKRVAEEAALQKRQQLGGEAFSILRKITNELFTRITEYAPIAKRENGIQKIFLGNASLGIRWLNGGAILPKDLFPRSKWDVVCGALIEVIQDSPKYVWSASLWYTNQGIESAFRWIEISYWIIQSNRMAPIALEDPDEADVAHAPIVSRYGIASKPKPIDDEAIDDFIERWAAILAKAHNGELRYPSKLPLD